MLFKLSLIATAVAIASPLQSQNIVFSIPDSNAGAGVCNVIPLGSTSTTSSFANCRYQTMITAADMQNTPGLICGLRFAACSTGVRHYDQLIVRMGHTTATSLSSNFDANLAPTAGFTLLDVSDHTWPTIADVWNDIGLRMPFPYDGQSNIVVDITSINGLRVSGSGSAGFHRDTRQRVYATNYAGQSSGSSGNAALKMQVHIGQNSNWVYGVGCAGSNGTPDLSFSGSSALGQTLTTHLSAAAAGAPVFLNIGVYTSIPFPLDLTPFGAPGCLIYSDVQGTGSTTADASGSASISLVVPSTSTTTCATLYFQWLVLDPPANQIGLSVSNYGRIVVGQ